MTSPSAPIHGAERIEVLDVLRGAAIFGILVANMLVAGGYIWLDPAARAALPSAAADGPVLLLIHALVEGKFYSIFSLLFGIGFAVQLGRADARGIPFPPFFRRRLAGLAMIGLAHAVLLWSGDILLLYALLGLLLVPFHRASDRTLLRGAALCLALPVLVYLGMLATGFGSFMAEPAADGSDFMAPILAGFREDSWTAAFRSNLVMVAGRWVDLFLTVRFPKVFGMFLLGLFLGRRGLGVDPIRDGALLRRTVRLGLAFGLPANAVVAWLADQPVYLPASWPGLLQTTAAAIGVPALALAYSAAIVLAFGTPAGRRLLRPVGVAGRMALSNYLLHSVVMTVIFYGWGLGWFGRLGPAVTTPLAMLICALQVPLSRAWLARFRFGPAEWLWRQFTYRRRIPLGATTAPG